MVLKPKTVRLERLSKVFIGPGGQEVKAVNDVTLTINQGELVTFLGPSGCGKTTTLRMIAGFENPSSGKVLIGDRDVTHVPPNNRNTAMVFQSYALFPHMTVEENVSYGLRFRDVGKAEAKERTQKIMELVGLSGFGKRQPGQLSGGQQQRVALARALVVEPEVLLFDEPLSNLDAKLREQMREEIRRIQTSLSITAVYVTHDQAEAMAISDQVVVMDHGIIQQMGSPKQIYTEPSSRFVADFIGKVNFLKGTVVAAGTVDRTVRVLGKDLRAHAAPGVGGPGSEVLVACRPEAASLLGYGEAVSKDATFVGRVVKAVYYGSYIEYGLELEPGQTFLLIDYNPARRGAMNAGDMAGIYLDEEALHVLPAK